MSGTNPLYSCASLETLLTSQKIPRFGPSMFVNATARAGGQNCRRGREYEGLLVRHW